MLDVINKTLSRKSSLRKLRLDLYPGDRCHLLAGKTNKHWSLKYQSELNLLLGGGGSVEGHRFYFINKRKINYKHCGMVTNNRSAHSGNTRSTPPPRAEKSHQE